MADVKSLSSSVVREYLSRKGLKETLAMLDREMPRTEDCIRNRAQLAKELHINTLMRKNKERQESFRTMLEVIVEFMMSKPSSKHSGPILPESERKLRPSFARDDHREGNTERKTSINIGDNENPTSERSETRKNMKHEVCSPSIKIDDKLKSSLTDTGDSRMDKVSDLDFNIKPEKSNSLTYIQSETLKTSVSEKSLKKDISVGLSQRPSEDDIMVTDDSVVKKQTSSNSRKDSRRNIGNVTGCVVRTGIHSSGKKESRNYTKGALREKPKYFQDDWNEGSDVHRGKTLENTSTDQQMPRNQELILERNKVTKNVQESFKERPNYLLEDVKKSSDFQGRKTPGIMEEQVSIIKKEPNLVPDWKEEILQKKDVRKSVSSSQHKTTKKEDLIFEDIDETLDAELQKMNFNPSSRKSTMSLKSYEAITLKQAKDLKTIVFGSPVSNFNSEWRHQGFTFSHFDDLKYGIVQYKGGPCGLLASVQAVVLKQLLFNDRLSGNKQRLRFSPEETRDALFQALIEILWRAGSYKTARVAIRSEKEQFMPSGGYKADRLTEKLVIYETNNYSELEMFIKENIKQFSSDDGGCILTLYSVILSRTVEKIKEDMDDKNGTLMGAHGYCTQDMVNLFITGKSISNTFDDVIELDSGGDTKSILKGIDQQSDIGLLSLFEHYKSCLEILSVIM